VSSTAIVLSAEQRAAILTPGNLLVRAGAGSGKTEVLARRFVALIAGEIEGRQPLTPAQVAAITFTEKAAYDMRARIASVLDERLLVQAQGERRSHLLSARAMLPLARISTIHAFCARILRENALDAALDPDFQVLDEYESQTFLERLCKQVLIDAVRQSDPGAGYLARARRLDTGTRREGALAIVMRILDELARLGRTPQWLYDATCETATRTQAEASRVAVLAGELSRLLDELLMAGTLSHQAEQTIAPLRTRHDEYRQRILAIHAQVEPEAFDFLREFCECIPKAQGRVKDCIASIKNIVTRTVNSRFGLDGELISVYGACRAIPRAREIAATIRDLALKFEAAKADERLVTFDDLLFRTRELLERSAGTRLRYQEMIRALLVDEFQDTDAVQHGIVARLIDPEPSAEAPELFIVGDEKQSIYRFRGADVAGFSRIRDRLTASSIHELPLLGNRRSSPNIVAFVNGIGAALMHSGEQPPPPYWVEWNSGHVLSALRTPELDSPVEIITAIPDWPVESTAPAGKRAQDSAPSTAGSRKLNAGRKRLLEGRAIASRIKQLVGNEMVTDSASELRPVCYRDIVLLLRAFTDVAIYEGALLDAGIPCYTVKGRGFFACQEVLDFIELLTVVDNPADSIALAAALRSPFFCVSDDCLAEIALHREQAGESVEFSPRSPFSVTFTAGGPTFSWLSAGRDDAIRAWGILDEFQKLRQRGTIMAVVEHALAATSYEAVMLGLRQGPQRVANLRKLAELARDFESRRLFTFHDFVVHLRRLAEQQPYEPPAQILGENENVVRLMTVHQAKGLEFPVVFVADAGRRPDNDIRNPVADPQNGLLLRDAVGSGMDEIPNHMLEEFRGRSNGEQQAESLRLLYVALTRARDRLIVSEGAMLQGWAKQIRNFVGDQIVAAFVKAGKEQELIERAGAKILLMRPESAQALPEISPGLDSPVNDQEGLAMLVQRRLSFEPPRPQELVISPTALADFDRCPRQFHFRHELKLPEHVREDTNAPFAGASVMGTVAHAVLERLQSDATNEGKIGELVDLLGIPAGLDSRARSMITTDLTRYMAKFVASAPAAREVSFFYHIGEALFVQGRIDALVEQGDRVIIRDYKYARATDRVGLYQVQMEAYALAAADAYPQSKVEAEIAFLKDDNVTVPVTLPPLPQIRARILSLGREIIAAQTSGGYSRKPPSASVCHKLHCGFVERCWSD
jgi:ATP-dependent exoDNAse (exonuclease V) beta subunit